MIDTHSHILPAMDDGAQDTAQAVKFIREAARQGVDTIIATPHVSDGVYNCDAQEILSACMDLNRTVEALGIPVQVRPGSEIRITADTVKDFDQGRLLTLNNSPYILVELPWMFMSHSIVEVIRQFRQRRIIPIIAHAERNPVILQKPGLAEELVFAGARIQVTAGSLTGDFGRQALKKAESLLSSELAFCIGSDIHPGRKYRMAKAKKKIAKIAGKAMAEKLFYENPLEILENQRIDLGDPLLKLVTHI